MAAKNRRRGRVERFLKRQEKSVREGVMLGVFSLLVGFAVFATTEKYFRTPIVYQSATTREFLRATVEGVPVELKDVTNGTYHRVFVP